MVRLACPCPTSLAEAQHSWSRSSMETNPFDLTPEQKGLLVTLAHATDKPVPALLTEAREELQEHASRGRAHDAIPLEKPHTPPMGWASPLAAE